MSLPGRAIENKKIDWLETQDNISKLGLAKIWFSHDLNKAVFLRSGRAEKLNHLQHKLELNNLKQIDPKISHLQDTFYFYNMANDEINNWVKQNLTAKTRASWFYILVPRAFAESPECASNVSPYKVETQQGRSFFQKFSNIVNGNFLKKMVGCSTQDPSINEKQNQSLSIEDFGKALKLHWEQLKEIISQLPTMPLPAEVKHELMCDAMSVGIFAAQGAALSLTGAGAFVAVPRLFLALKRLMNSTKYLSRKKISSPVAMGAGTLVSRTENVYKNQKKFIEDLRAGQEQILDKGGRLTDSGKANSKYSELLDWANAEVSVQRDLIQTLNKLEKLKDQSALSRQISIQAEISKAQKRIDTLAKAFN